MAGVRSVVEEAVYKEREMDIQRQAEINEQARIDQEKRRIWRKNHRKEIVITFLIFFIIASSLIVYHEFKMLIPICYSSEYLKGLKYTEVVQKLKGVGFSNVYTKEISDLTIYRDDEESLVTDVKLMFGSSFDEDTKYPSNLLIIVVYHTVKLYNPPITSKDAKGMNYLDVIEKFEGAGFTNVTTIVEYDIVTGWLTDDGEVKSVTINGDKKYDYYDKFRLDADIVITYHTLIENKPK